MQVATILVTERRMVTEYASKRGLKKSAVLSYSNAKILTSTLAEEISDMFQKAEERRRDIGALGPAATQFDRLHRTIYTAYGGQ